MCGSDYEVWALNAVAASIRLSNTNFKILMSQHIFLIDTAYAERVVFDLTVNFERMLGRRIPPADLPRWLDCLALDGGIRPGDNDLRAYFLHDKAQTEWRYFTPARFADDLSGKAFRDNLGEFSLQALAIEPLVSGEDLFVQSFEALLLDREVESIMLVADFEGQTEESRSLLSRVKHLCHTPPQPEEGEPLPPKSITLFAMQPLAGRGFQTEILGYSLMAALGVEGRELAEE